MKKTILSLTLLAGATAAAQAQSGPGTRFGLKVGVVAADVAGKDADVRFGDNTQNRFGFQAGITTTAAFGVDGFFQLHPELLYSQKGFQIKRNGQEQRTTLHYIDLPLLARINAAGLIFEVGPQLGYLIGRSNRGKVTGAETTNMQKFDVGYIVGVGYQLESGPNVGIRYNGGVRTLFEDSAGSNNRVRNSVFQFQLGFAFPGSGS
ncbi:porin family protein [uncultured Hymenobacter sp.]|uniref:porin family protein n=1 Tax=uncultured Hymenobacter sp. TaxID=170016 RepID=UPI0035CAEA00